ncbi:MAG: ATP-binding cassette domain-containing protein [Rhodoferax sp.]|uniref:ATP-binding cassette domain-containing protein n=1 Tax=Rhodoferax sp. TaxID=50421 RepID=UPI002ACD5ED3|nr:ATP-binding cassette domain-containing protein [Rhodoferax sp.]MDZ7893296.1 ATP-binding cassette domain-containing protein [Rhodoferax sp.]
MSLQIGLRHLNSPASTLLRDLDLQIPAGTVHTLMGPSGCGKSSVLSLVCGTLDPSMQWEGSVTLDGRRIDSLPVQARRVGLLFQDDLLFAHMTVRENLLFAVPAGAQPAREQAVKAALADVEMQDHLHANPARLSGGQRARVALARALLAQPRALLLDEPFSKLDAALRARMRTLVFSLVAERNIPALLVTHDAADVADPAHLSRLGDTHSV